MAELTAFGNWSGREDLNFRPQRPERCALTRLRYSPTFAPYCNAQRPERCALTRLRYSPTFAPYCNAQRPERCALTRLRYSPMPIYYKGKRLLKQPFLERGPKIGNLNCATQ
jgi:hypothetical protein